MESIAPLVTPKNSLGAPNFLKSLRSSLQFGCGIIATRYPAASSVRPITAVPNDG